MKPAPFDYSCPDTLEEAVAVLAAHRGDAKLMAGGQSLVPMLNFRVVRPGLVIDINRLLELDFVRHRDGGGLSIGGLTRHRVLETSPVVAQCFPVIPQAMRHVAHLAVRNRGTIGGSLAHADPSAELPLLVSLLDATMIARSIRGERSIAADEFFVGALTTALEDDEILVRIEAPGLPDGVVGGFEEVARRPGDFALAAVGVLLQVSEGCVRNARIVMTGVADTPVRLAETEEMLAGKALTDDLLAHVVRTTCAPLQPRSDLQASSEYRRHLAGVLLERRLSAAWRLASENSR